jgi:hypothetical protein
LTGFLVEAGISPAEAEALLLDVLFDLEEEGAAPADSELVRRVDAACAGYAARRKQPYQGLRKSVSPPPTRTIPRQRSRRR